MTIRTQTSVTFNTKEDIHFLKAMLWFAMRELCHMRASAPDDMVENNPFEVRISIKEAHKQAQDLMDNLLPQKRIR